MTYSPAWFVDCEKLGHKVSVYTKIKKIRFKSYKNLIRFFVIIVYFIIDKSDIRVSIIVFLIFLDHWLLLVLQRSCVYLSAVVHIYLS